MNRIALLNTIGEDLEREIADILGSVVNRSVFEYKIRPAIKAFAVRHSLAQRGYEVQTHYEGGANIVIDIVEVKTPNHNLRIRFS